MAASIDSSTVRRGLVVGHAEIGDVEPPFRQPGAAGAGFQAQAARAVR
jgi:hypothetical protein